MPNNQSGKLLQQYDEMLDLHVGLAGKVEELIKEMLSEGGISVHSVTSRVKTRESLERKVTQPDKSYSDLGIVTDIVGIRIITYFEDDVDRAAGCLDRQFEVDWSNSVDRRTTLDPDRFGYLSLHHVASFQPDRTDLVEYRRFAGLKFEIQTRSILQHAWAEIEHDLGYKTHEGVPREARRRFSSLAGLLEIADREFRSLRDELEAYERDVSQRIESDPDEVGIDKASVTAFLKDSSVIEEIDRQIVDTFPGSTYVVEVDPEYVEEVVSYLKSLRIKTIRELQRLLFERRTLIPKFARIWLERAMPRMDLRPIHLHFRRGQSLFYFMLVYAATSLERPLLERFVSTLRLSPHHGNTQEVADQIGDIYDEVK